ncbi:helix-turn-helix transcriptional regulator [Bifidobacterium xylocopae]|uniref:HTH araC/xylS-type domain-containing protein n=1 Tax=Bifidobacterium xylocopae TaxID=2493119 RepID=A0A366KBP6_9BIFI|nr:AraC family transcriptional regulator [Bifidobacterium xylocopae]RBP99156.1 hypothetical protein CRD59_05185 [Bifidobacterium xylocopae]
MPREIIADLSGGAAGFESAGRFVGSPGWIHGRRRVDSFELILVEEGTLPLTVNGQCYELGPRNLILIPAQALHEGSKRLMRPLTFFWAHFSLQDWYLGIRAGEGGSDTVPDSAIRLPLGPMSFKSDRLAIMSNQLLDIYQLTYPKPSLYGNYFMTCMLFEIAGSASRLGRGRTANTESRRLQQVQDWIRVNACDKISVKWVARHFNYSPSYLSTIYKREFGISVSGQIAKWRIERAQELLLSTSEKVWQIAEACGYRDPKYFMRVFKSQTGLTPSRYRSSFSRRHYNNA